MTSTITPLVEIRGIDHREAMAMASTEAARLLDVVDRLAEHDWTRPTDCAGWDVKALLSHESQHTNPEGLEPVIAAKARSTR